MDATGLCALLALAEAFAPAALPSALRSRAASLSVCSLRASADGVSRRSVLGGAAVAAVGLAAAP